MSGLPVYLKAAAGALPGASRLPFLAGGGGAMPEMKLEAEGLQADRSEVAQYARVCGFRLRDALPPTFPHVLAFPLHMQLMTDGRFPFAAVGLVHIENRIDVHRPLGAGEPLDLRVRPGQVKAHPKGQAFALLSEVRAGGELVWEEESTMLRRGGGDSARGGRERAEDGPERAEAGPEPAFVAEWRLPGDLGRRYASVSGDRNPIHLHPLTARLFGFPRAIAHGMWTMARCLAALEPTLPAGYSVSVEFRKPILLPGSVTFERAGERFRVRSEGGVHLMGRFQSR
jgi:acyl dehydratase